MNLHKLHPQRKRKILKDISHTLSLYLDLSFLLTVDFPGGSDGKASAYNVGDQGLIPGSGRSLGEENGSPLQYSCLENLMDGGAW